jgi:activator of HSP90 ATPase
MNATQLNMFIVCPYRTERDVTGWSTDKLKELLLGLRVEGPEGSCEVTDIPNLDGEASINNRKGKLIYFYEWNVKATWTGECSRY